MFSQAVIEKLGFYVYFLKDPRNDMVFYVGKGRGNRVFNHMICALDTDSGDDRGMDEKLETIREITGSGHEVQHYILRHDLDEKSAFEIEASLIDFLGTDKLSNIQGGVYSRDFGIKTAQEIRAMYEARGLLTTEPILLLNLNKEYRRDMTAEELYEAARKSWVIGPRRELVKFAVATYRGLTREVYHIDKWHEVEFKGKTRWAFIGTVADDDIRRKLLYRSIAHLYRQGNSNPIMYLNC